MKNLLIALLFCATSSKAQYVSYGYTNLGPSLSVGAHVKEKIDLSIDYDYPIFSAIKSSFGSLNAGWNFTHNPNDTENFLSVTPRIGVAKITMRQLADDYIIVTRGFKPLYQLEVGLQGESARLSVFSKYCDRTYVGASIKVFFD